MPTSFPSHRTLNATPVVIENFGPDLQEDEVCRVNVFIFASDHTTGQGFWHFSGLMRRMPGGLAGGIFGELVSRKSAPAATWNASVAVSAGGRLQATLTGASVDIVDWLVTTDDPVCMHGAFQGV